MSKIMRVFKNCKKDEVLIIKQLSVKQNADCLKSAFCVKPSLSELYEKLLLPN